MQHQRLRFLPIFVLALGALGAGCSQSAGAADGGSDVTNPSDASDSGSTDVDAGSTDSDGSALSDSGTTDTDASAGDGFTAAAHAPLVQVPDQGGRRLAHPQLVTVTFAGYTYQQQVQDFADWIATSDWITAVGTEYGVGTGNSVAKVVVDEAPPTTIDDTEIQVWIRQRIADGTLPTPPMPDNNDYLYLVYYPSTTTITQSGTTSCQEFGGYHGSIGVGSLNISYAVLPDCGGFGMRLTALDNITIAASHEIMEAATDADPIGEPAWALSFAGANASPWVILGGEVGDLCTEQNKQYPNFWVQRIWSNVAAAADQNPCIPSDGRVYFSVSTSPEMIYTGSAGQTITIPLTGWSTAPVADWLLGAQPFAGNFNPTVNIDTQTMNNGMTATMTVRIPAGTPHQSFTGIVVESAIRGMGHYSYPIAVFVP